MHHLTARATLLAVFITTGCFGPTTTTAAPPVSDAGATRAGIAVVGRGGVAGLERITVLDSATARYMTVTRRACGIACAPLDSASGTLTSSEVAHIYDMVDAEQVFSLRADYGVCPTCADRATITTAVFANSRHKVITSTGEATPDILGRVHVALAEAIRSARGDR